MYVSPVSLVSNKSYNNINFGKKNKNHENHNEVRHSNPVKKLIVPTAAAVLAMTYSHSAGAENLVLDRNDNHSAVYEPSAGIYEEDAPNVFEINQNAVEGKLIKDKMFKVNDYQIWVSSYDNDNNPKTAEKLHIKIMPEASKAYEGVIKSVGKAELEITGAYDTKWPEKIRYNQTEIMINNEKSTHTLLNKEVYDYIMNFAQNQDEIKNNGAVQIKNVNKKIRGTYKYGLQNVPDEADWLVKAKGKQFNYRQAYGDPILETPPIETKNGKFIISAYNKDGNKDNYELLTIQKVASNYKETQSNPELEIDGIGVINSYIMDLALEKTPKVQYAPIGVYCRGLREENTMVDYDIFNMLKKIYSDTNNNKALDAVNTTQEHIVSGTGVIANIVDL